MGAERTAALWEAVSGEWGLKETRNLQNGYLTGTANESGRAEILYRGDLDEPALVIETWLKHSALHEDSTQLSIVLSDANSAQGTEVATLTTQGDDIVTFTLERGGQRTTAVARMDTHNPCPSVTVVRTPETLSVELNHRPAAQLVAPSPARVRGLKYRLTMPPGRSLSLRAVSIGSDPLSTTSLPPGARHLARMLRHASPPRSPPDTGGP